MDQSQREALDQSEKSINFTHSNHSNHSFFLYIDVVVLLLKNVLKINDVSNNANNRRFKQWPKKRRRRSGTMMPNCVLKFILKSNAVMPMKLSVFSSIRSVSASPHCPKRFALIVN
jgi:hypothetical protein